jgi:8-oxo-dGTP diphosphatase
MGGEEQARTVLVAACALLDEAGHVLIAKRPKGHLEGLWEFPGGKIEPWETPEAALVRELNEELGIAVEMSALIPLTFASYPYADFHLMMPLFLCQCWQGPLSPKEGQELAWVFPAELCNYDMPPADESLKESLAALVAQRGAKE